MGRELLRAFCVILLVVLNTIIIKGLQMAKKNRRLLIKRSSAIDSNDVVPSQIKDKQRYHIESKVEKIDPDLSTKVQGILQLISPLSKTQ
jgi:hypothetical protein